MGVPEIWKIDEESIIYVIRFIKIYKICGYE